jgi:hypothetical protein
MTELSKVVAVVSSLRDLVADVVETLNTNVAEAYGPFDPVLEDLDNLKDEIQALQQAIDSES